MEDADLIENSDLDLTDQEKILKQVVVRVWKPTQAWILLFLLPFVGLLPFVDRFPFLIPILILTVLWYGTYFVRQRWRLTLTNRQIVARQLLPYPLTTLSPIHYFPLHKIEGLSIGPRAFRNILLLGIFISTNLGVTLLKSGLSPEGYDLPDTLEAVLLFMHGVSFLPFLGTFANLIEDFFQELLAQIPSALIALGIFFIALGVLTVIASVPRRFHLQIRMRHSKDFRLSAGVQREFWEACYNQLYKENIVEAPNKYKKWRFPWLEGEKELTSADLEDIVYTNRFISLFTIYAGSLRIWQRAETGTLNEDVILWAIVAVIDVLIAGLALYFSKKKNEMVVTNRRIIFAQEMRDISGAFGRRLYLMSDISRDDVAGFHILRIQRLSYRYLFLTIIFSALTIVFWPTLNYEASGVFVRLVFILIILLFATFINQTYVQFDLKTKGHEIWHMRHQLSNPLTFMRQLVGNDENRLITTLMSNRLEEKEVVDSMQIIRSGDTGLRAKLFDDTKYYGSSSVSNERVKRTMELQDMLLQDEKILYEANVSREVPRRVLSLSIASMFILGMIATYIVPFTLYPENTYDDLFIFMAVIAFFVTLIMVVALWVTYYSLFKARIIITKARVFFMDIKLPPWIFYLIGVSRISEIEETLQSQIHSTYTSRQFTQQQYWRELVQYNTRFVLWGIPFGLSIAILEALLNSRIPLPGIELLIPVFAIIFYFSSLSMAWYLGNGFIAFIRSLPKRVVNTMGVGSHFTVPFASKEKADTITQTVWNGIIESPE